MKVRITGLGLLAGDAPGELSGFKPRDHVMERKHLKLMARPVRLGVGAVRQALESRPGWEKVPPEQRGLYVGCTPAGAEPGDLAAAFNVATVDGELDVGAFGELGIPQVHPLWLVKGLSNNILGYASAYHDLRGVNTNRCDGRISGLAALLDGARAVAEGRCALVIAGGADSLVGGEAWLGRPVGEGAAFFVLEAGDGPALGWIVDGGILQEPGQPASPAGARGELGAASGVVELAAALRAGVCPERAQVRDEHGATVWIALRS